LVGLITNLKKIEKLIELSIFYLNLLASN